MTLLLTTPEKEAVSSLCTSDNLQYQATQSINKVLLYKDLSCYHNNYNISQKPNWKVIHIHNQKIISCMVFYCISLDVNRCFFIDFIVSFSYPFSSPVLQSFKMSKCRQNYLVYLLRWFLLKWIFSWDWMGLTKWKYPYFLTNYYIQIL